MLILAAALVARLPRRDLLLSLLLAAIGTVQVSLAGAHRWVGGLHPLLALVVLASRRCSPCAAGAASGGSAPARDRAGVASPALGSAASRAAAGHRGGPMIARTWRGAVRRADADA